MRMLTRLEMEIWQLIGGEQTRPENFTMNTANKIRYELMELYPQAKYCALKVTPKGGRYEILQILFDEALNPIKTGQGTCVGRKMSAAKIGEDVVKFLDGNPYKLME